MELAELLSTYPDDVLDRLAADKVDEVAGLRLPRSVMVQEIASALSSLSYVARVLAPARPPTYAILKLLLNASDHSLPSDGFREAALAVTEGLSASAADPRSLPSGKNHGLYLRILYAAWENDGEIDRTEALLLEALRNELSIRTREHLVLEHHPDVRPLWDSPKAFEVARNHLLGTGIVLTHGESYVVADEVCRQIRRVWSMDLEDAAYERFLDLFTVNQLRKILEVVALPLSGSKDERIRRLVEGLVPPEQILDALHISEVKDLCRATGLPVSAAKTNLIGGLLDHFDRGDDLQQHESDEVEPTPEPEPRLLAPDRLRSLLMDLTLDQLQDVLSAAGLRRWGSKTERMERLLDSPWSEHTLLGHLPKADLASICRKAGLRISGVKQELIDRLIDHAREDESEPTSGSAASAHPAEDAAPPSSPTTGPGPVLAETVPPAEERRPDPPGLRGIQTDFPDLDHGEQVMVALLRQARSLTEQDVERAARHHDLGWVLSKAHMADLLARLGRDGPPPIRVRSAGGVNIYEWIGTPAAGRERVERDAARDVVDALRQGVVPDRRRELLAVGQERARRHLVDLLGHVRTGRSEFKFIRGAYGAGKTFLCAWLRERAFDEGFAVASVRVGPDQPLSDLPVFYAGMIQGLRTPEKRDSSALADVLESWLLTLHRRTAQVEGLDPFSPGSREQLAALVEQRVAEELARFGGLDPSFGPALLHYYRARLHGDHDTVNTALAWLRGSRALSADALRRIGVRGCLEGEDVFPRMRAILQVIGGGRLAGLLLIVDELELVRKFPHARQREQAYETLRLLIDEAGENGLPGCLMVFTGTDGLFDDERYGLPSYEALANRISTPPGIEGRVSVRQPVVHLDPLDADLLLAVACRVRDVHGAAYGWGAGARVPDEILQRLVTERTSFGGGSVSRLPRPFLRELVHVLDLCEENPGIRAEECLHPPGDEASLAATVTGLLEL